MLINPSYLGGGQDQEDQVSRPVLANTS
jgi:hypothetical protein